jgi:hypothetical protein
MTTVTVADVDAVRVYLPAQADELYEWDEGKITAVLEVTNCSVPQTVRQFWLERVMNTAEYIDVNESGSSRTLSMVHQNAKAMLDYWDKRVEAEGLVTARRPITFGEIDRGLE